MIEKLAGSTRGFGILLVIAGILLSVPAISPTTAVDGHTVLFAGIGLAVYGGNQAAARAAVNAEAAADKVQDVQTQLHGLTNGGLKAALQDATAAHTAVLQRIESAVVETPKRDTA